MELGILCKAAQQLRGMAVHGQQQVEKWPTPLDSPQLKEIATHMCSSKLKIKWKQKRKRRDKRMLVGKQPTCEDDDYVNALVALLPL